MKGSKMPSSEECIEAQANVKKWAIEALVKEGHPEHSAQMIVDRMSYDEQVELAEKIHGKIYRGAYSPY
jgi:hypothetical protein